LNLRQKQTSLERGQERDSHVLRRHPIRQAIVIVKGLQALSHDLRPFLEPGGGLFAGERI
jgi:hypothetical protein